MSPARHKGWIEARGGDFFDTERVEQAFRDLCGEPELAKVADAVIGRIDDFAGGEHRSDDVTLILLRRN